MHIEVVTLFPESVTALLQFGVTGRAVERGLLKVGTANPRDHATDRHKTVDDRLSGGELPALVMVDALARLIPGALNDDESAAQDSFENGLLDCPHYTRPEEIDGQRVPEVLLSGDHAAIRRWRMKEMLGRTWLRR